MGPTERELFYNEEVDRRCAHVQFRSYYQEIFVELSINLIRIITFSL
jgi:hypothetical protein